MTATIIQFPVERWQRYKTSPCPKHPEGRRWQHGEAVGDGTRYCKNQDVFCSHDPDRRAICDFELGRRPDGSPLQHGDLSPSGKRFCERKHIRCECNNTFVALCGRGIRKTKKRKGRKS
jgi:hypothetical protein